VIFGIRKKENYMFGLWFSIIGLFFGTLCSLKAKELSRSQKDWFTLGFIFSFLALVVLLIFSYYNKNEELSTANEISLYEQEFFNSGIISRR
jgi:hypothetical protein